jgi:hypothetical protein
MPHMTCKELQSDFKDLNLTDGLQANTGAWEHIASCAECSQFVETERELSARLRLLRESAPHISTSLDEAVLCNYRKQMQERFAGGSPAHRLSAFIRFRWSAAVAAVVLVLTILLISHRQSVPTKAQVLVTQTAVVAQTTQPTPKTEIIAQKPRRKRPEVASAARKQAENLPIARSTQLPEEFRSLMYCDELSCDGGMEMLRVQLPSSAVGFMPPSVSANRYVSADVLVGSDGIARGIRIVQ